MNNTQEIKSFPEIRELPSRKLPVVTGHPLSEVGLNILKSLVVVGLIIALRLALSAFIRGL